MKRLLMALMLVWALPLHSEGVDKEALGNLALGQKAESVRSLLGKPDSKGKDVLWEAIGEWVQEWRYPSRGLVFLMASEQKGGAKTVLAITATQGCGLRTARGVEIGSTEAEVRRAYRAVEDKAAGVRGESFVAGSIYGGVIFQFKNGRVSEIFVGAAAE